ncbi:hypothetical protein EDI_023790 [Entamoeba dispar SAW760]|uniref:Uncharacterized protein n=1 Tax=Entamoeba dispar (strain ATCC PRA-260 / SAW760) TaxID=370354 RepID=B0EHA2_ENTDS|nr:uncharacterized protein EDI_023790 [Entamoeba dispar SAW760]EDR26095.1 hypothetical protein EDI_023790 [Entamoeba dispar SAW760]|eukprot:EDR26095.1 hypothetical protein EDI_023790 [Entamoeba dispar SAW760]
MNQTPQLCIYLQHPICQIIHSTATQFHIHKALQKYENLSHRIFLSVLFAYCNTFFSGIIFDYQVNTSLYIMVVHTSIAFILESNVIFSLLQRYILIDDMCLAVKAMRAGCSAFLSFSEKHFSGSHFLICAVYALFKSHGSDVYGLIIRYCLGIPVKPFRLFIPMSFINEIPFLIVLHFTIPYMNNIHKTLFIITFDITTIINIVLSNHTEKSMQDYALDYLVKVLKHYKKN